MQSLAKYEKTLHFTHFDKKKKKNHISGCKIVHKYINATVTVHICTVTVAFAFNILPFFSLHLTLFFSLVWLSLHALFSSTDLHCSLESRHSRAIVDHLTHRCLRRSPMLSFFFSVWWFWDFDKWVLMVRYSVALLSLTIAVPPPITSLTTAHADRPCSHWSLLLSFFFVWWFWDFDQWILMVLISGFDGFDQWVLMILISGFGILIGGLMTKAGLMIADAPFFLCLIVDGGWVLSQE